MESEEGALVARARLGAASTVEQLLLAHEYERAQLELLVVRQAVAARFGGKLQVVQIAKARVDALLLNETSRTDTYPYIEIDENISTIGHEATVSKVGDEQLFYLMSRGLSEEEAMAMVVRGFIEPIAKEVPLEYAIERNRLIELEMEGSVG